jgi:hypothetical protein
VIVDARTCERDRYLSREHRAALQRIRILLTHHHRTMTAAWIVCFVVALGLTTARASDEDLHTELVDDAASARFLYFNTSSTATSLTLLGALILLGVIAYLVYVGGLLSGSSAYNRNDFVNGGYGNDPYYQGEYAQQYRSAQSGYDFNALNILQWISMAQEAYEKFDVNDLECQKRLICEVMREPQFYGDFAKRAKSGFQWAGTLADLVALPDDVRELVDEYLDASSRSESQKECHEYFQCPFSIKETISKNLL